MKIVYSPFPNIINIANYTLNKTSKLPLSVIHGTENERFELAERLTYKLKNELDKLSQDKKYKVSDFINKINDILAPYKIDIDVKEMKKQGGYFKTKGLIKRSVNENRNINQIDGYYYDYYEENTKGYTIMLELSEDKSEINDKYTALHEARHLFDFICNPKTIINRSANINNGEDLILEHKMLNAFIENINLLGKKFLKSKAEKYIKQMNDNVAIDCLQYIRSSLKSENNAYKNELKFLYEKPLKNFYKIICVKDFLMYHNYSKRLKVANELLAEKLDASRKKV